MKNQKNQTRVEVGNYVWVSKNIYKTGNRYRVRVAGKSCYTTTKTEAFRMKRVMLDYYKD